MMRAFRIFAGRMLAILLGAALLCCVDLPACAASGAELDFTRTGTISLTLKTAEGKTVSGGVVTLYQVAELYLDDGNMAWRYTSAFSGCDAALEVEDTSLPTTLATYARKQSVSGVSTGAGSDGTLRFADLTLGLYLLVQTGASDRSETFSPFVVTVPMEEGKEDGSVWIYEVDASPKVGVVAPGKPPEHRNTSGDSGESERTSSESTTVIAVASPQTGQSVRSVLVLAAGSLLLMLLAWLLRRCGGNEQRDGR